MPGDRRYALNSEHCTRMRPAALLPIHVCEKRHDNDYASKAPKWNCKNNASGTNMHRICMTLLLETRRTLQVPSRCNAHDCDVCANLREGYEYVRRGVSVVLLKCRLLPSRAAHNNNNDACHFRAETTTNMIIFCTQRRHNHSKDIIIVLTYPETDVSVQGGSSEERQPLRSVGTLTHTLRI